MKLFRTVRKLDNVLEVLLFDVALATPRRRRVAAGLTALAGAACYLLAGILFTPFVPLRLDPPSSAPYIDDASWTSPALEVGLIAAELTIKPERAAKLDAELTRYAAPLARLTAELDRPGITAFPRAPWFRTTREASNLLIVRGLRHVARGEEHAAFLDWIRAAKLGLATTARGPADVTLIEGMIGTAIERHALRAIQKQIDAKSPSYVTKRDLKAYLDARPDHQRSMVAYMRGERAFFERATAQMIASGTLGIGADDGLAWVNVCLPARHADRVRFLTAARERMRHAYDEMVGASVKTLQPADLDRLAGDGTPVTLSAASYVRGMFSQTHAVGVVTRSVLECFVPNVEAAGKRVDLLDEQVRKLRAEVPNLDLSGI